MSARGSRSLAMRTLDAMVDLRMAVCRSARMLVDPAIAQRALRADWRAGIASARAHGVLELLPSASRPEVLAAAFVMRPHPLPYFAGHAVDLLCRTRDRRTHAWMRECIARHADALRGEVSVHVSVRDADLLLDLERIGVHTRSIWLAGHPKRLLSRLRRAYGALEWEGIECRPLETKRQIAAMTALTREEFSRNPQFGERAASRRFLRAHFDDLARELAAGKRNRWVLMRGSELVGHFGFPHRPMSSFGSSVAAFGVTLRRDIQGKGYAKVAYRTMLDRMNELGVRLVIGMTAQPPVMHLSAVMGRRLFGYELSAGPATFAREHFRYPPR
jgi:hypothetical protein